MDTETDYDRASNRTFSNLFPHTYRDGIFRRNHRPQFFVPTIERMENTHIQEGRIDRKADNLFGSESFGKIVWCLLLVFWFTGTVVVIHRVRLDKSL